MALAGFSILSIQLPQKNSTSFEKTIAMFTPKSSSCPIRLNSLGLGMDMNLYIHIGLSKLCCLLCWLLLRTHGAFHIRGTHETIMHKWEMPTVLMSKNYSTEYHPVIRDFLGVIRTLLQNSLDQPFSSKHPTLLAQSSAALSTTQTGLDREKAQMEKPQLNMR